MINNTYLKAHNNTNNQDWIRPKHWPDYPVFDDGIYFLVALNSIYDCQFLGFSVLAQNINSNSRLEIYFNNVLKETRMITTNASTGYKIYIDGTDGIDYKGDGNLWCWVRLVFKDISGNSFFNFAGGSSTTDEKVYPVGNSYKSSTILELILNDTTNKFFTFNSGNQNDYFNNTLASTLNIRHFWIRNTKSNLTNLNFNYQNLEHITGYENLPSSWHNATVKTYLFGVGSFPSGLPTTFSFPNLTGLVATFYGYVNYNFKSFPTITLNTTTNLKTIEQAMNNPGLTGLIVTECGGITSYNLGILNGCRNLTLLELHNFKLSISITATGLYKGGIDNFVNSLADMTGFTPPNLTMTAYQAASCNQTNILNKNWNLVIT